MATELMEPEAKTSQSRTSATAEPTVRQIIAKGRSAPASSWGPWGLAASTGLLMWASFTPLNWSPLGWICLVPLILLVRIRQRTRWMYTACYAGGLLFWIATLQWMRLGHPTMYAAWVALALYLAAYFSVFVLLSRIAVHRARIPLTVSVPVVWVGLEYLRAHLMTGFAWYFLGHSQYRWIELIQISDLVGAYGVSFVVALMAACLANLIPAHLLARFRILPSNCRSDPSSVVRSPSDRQKIAMVAGCLTVFLAVVVYGFVRRGQAEFVEGPRIGLIQGNFTTSVKGDPGEAQRIFNTHYRLTGEVVRHEYQPDVIVWPETMYRSSLLVPDPELSDEELIRMTPEIPVEAWRAGAVQNALSDLSKQTGAAMIIGIDAGVAKKDGFRHFNSAVFVRPDVGVSGRYDKLHRVIFGEYIPLRETFPWLYQVTPFAANFGIAAGERISVFNYKDWRMVPIICFEDTVPHLVRRMVQSTAQEVDGQTRTVDCLVNLTNDGWFHGSSELDQHLITAAFRSVECRTPMVRAVNTGISAVIDGDGVIREPDVFIDGDGEGRTSMRDPKTGRWHKQLNAAIIDTIPLDARQSVYVKAGDWFAGLCGFGTLFLVFVPLFVRPPVEQSGSGNAEKSHDRSDRNDVC